MSEAAAPYVTESDPTDAPRLTPAVQWLIGLNIAVYFLQVTIVQPSDLQAALGFEPQRFPSHWWGLLTYAFAHGGFWHIALNMYSLWVFGPRVEHAWSAPEFTRFYLVCALGGALAHFALVRDGVLIGASAGVMGVMVAYASRWPNDEVFLFGVIPMRVRWLVVLLTVLNLMGGLLAEGSGVAYLAHVGGIAAGWLYLRTMHFSAERVRSHVATAPEYPEDGPRPVPRGTTRPREPRSEIDDVVAKSRAMLGAPVRRPVAATKVSEPKRREALDRVLDKIAATGMQSLTTDERRMLDDESKRLRAES